MFRNLRFVYITTKDREEAKKIGLSLLQDRLASCVNILDGMESMYHWKGKIETSKEAVLIVKAPQHNVGRITRMVKKMHSYDCPCIVSLTLTEQEGNEDYLKWLMNEARQPGVELTNGAGESKEPE